MSGYILVIICTTILRYSRNNAIFRCETFNTDATTYTMRYPSYEKYSGVFSFLVSFFLTGLTLWSIYNEGLVESGYSGHLVLFLSLTTVSLFLTLFAYMWRLDVNGDQIILYSLFHRKLHISVQELDYATLDFEQGIILYFHGKRLTKAPYGSDYYPNLYRLLTKHNKMKKERKRFSFQ